MNSTIKKTLAGAGVAAALFSGTVVADAAIPDTAEAAPGCSTIVYNRSVNPNIRLDGKWSSGAAKTSFVYPGGRGDVISGYGTGGENGYITNYNGSSRVNFTKGWTFSLPCGTWYAY